MKTIKELRQNRYKVRVLHWRYVISSTKYGELITKRDKLNGETFDIKGGKTQIQITTPEEKEYSAVAICSKEDNFNRKLGNQICLGRIFKQIEIDASKVIYDEIDRNNTDFNKFMEEWQKKHPFSAEKREELEKIWQKRVSESAFRESMKQAENGELVDLDTAINQPYLNGIAEPILKEIVKDVFSGIDAETAIFNHCVNLDKETLEDCLNKIREICSNIIVEDIKKKNLNPNTVTSLLPDGLKQDVEKKLLKTS